MSLVSLCLISDEEKWIKDLESAHQFVNLQEREYELTGGIRNKKEKIQEQIEILISLHILIVKISIRVIKLEFTTA